VPVVEGHFGRRAQDADYALLVGNAELFQHCGVGLEVVQVVLLLEAWILEDFAGPCSVGDEALEGDRLGHDDLIHETHVEVVRNGRVLIVEHGELRDAQSPRRQSQVVGIVSDGHVDVCVTHRSDEVRRAACQANCFGRDALAPMLAGDHGA